MFIIRFSRFDAAETVAQKTSPTLEMLHISDCVLCEATRRTHSRSLRDLSFTAVAVYFVAQISRSASEPALDLFVLRPVRLVA